MLNRILSLVGWLGTALVVAAFALRFGFEGKAQWAGYAAWAGLACVLVYTLSQWRDIAGLFSRREARYGSLAVTSVVLVLAILVAINYIGVRQNKRWDLTSGKQFSLSDQTHKAIAALDAPLEVLVFTQEYDFPRYQDLLNEYQYASKQITTQYVDPDKNPTAATQNEVKQYGTIVLNYKGRTERVVSDTEQDVTNGIIKVTSGKQRAVYFTQGHGEKDPLSSDQRTGYSGIADALKGENYTVEKIVLTQTPELPEAASLVVIAGPRTDFLPAEIESLKAYLGKFGKLLLELDPPEKPDDPPLTNLIALAHDYGIDVGQDVVVDPRARMMGAEADVPFVASYPEHPITDRFQVMTLYPLVRSVTPVAGGVNGRTAQPIAETSGDSWSETDVRGLLTERKATIEPEKGDRQGPIPIAAAVADAKIQEPSSLPEGSVVPSMLNDGSKPETRLVVVGDSDFGTNSVLAVAGNRDLFMNMAGWLTQQENLISIRPKEAGDSRLVMTVDQQRLVMFASLLFLPAVVFGAGIVTWWRRR
ncbi:MAG: GldG family protein [Acidobacteria bacterium]|nr:GldG family protein [Acidobacteriota bacterium]